MFSVFIFNTPNNKDNGMYAGKVFFLAGLAGAHRDSAQRASCLWCTWRNVSTLSPWAFCSQTGSPVGPELSVLHHSNIIVGFYDWISRPFVLHFLLRHPFTQKKPCSPLDCPWLNGPSFHDFQWKLVPTAHSKPLPGPCLNSWSSM